ncbi:MAG: flavodoxin-dependent (E)-4-hydroxy-3-methylbut-2-enyl-diphosphate synthase, partial [Verrucomicrobiota bacterium]|nr:flavodoxin-dependent (E)-4-hydroxy-3-methylbut-2-enyl-diphosphate synthase [Verrucomicrobiota bacterium]
MNYCASPYRNARRDTRPVAIGDPENGGVLVGGGEPVVRQSMITCSTLDTDACIEQSMALVEAGCQIVRITAQTKRYAANLEPIVAGIRARGSNVP